jgi:acetyl-CoA carboxylase biotin carboxylase subunit
VRLRRILVANRGEIAVRIVRACFDEGIDSVAVVARPDLDSLAARLADQVVVLEGTSTAQTYLSVGQIISAALATGCDAVHPGYGFLSERPALARACAEHGLKFVGPSAETIARGGDKLEARALAAQLGIPVGVGSGDLETADDAAKAAADAGYPVLLKAAAGGGGRGMSVVRTPEEIDLGFARAQQEALAAFGDGRMYLEHYVSNARHVEVQILADQQGNVVHLGDRDCSVQRRHQKLVEEAPAVAVASSMRTALAEAAIALCRALDYRGAATVEFLVDGDSDVFSFLEINTRLQVEHPVTEMVTGIDIVREQLSIAAGQPLSFTQKDVTVRGHAIECRLNAEDARAGFLPAPGTVTGWVPPQGVDLRVDSHCYPGYRIPPNYDSLLAKLIARGDDRAGAVDTLSRALHRFRIEGVATTIDFHRAVVRHGAFRANRISTRWVESEFIPNWADRKGS